MSDLESQIASLRTLIDSLPPGSAPRITLEAGLQALLDQQPAAPPPAPLAVIGSVGGDTVARDKIIQNFFGGQPGPDGGRLLLAYLGSWLDANKDVQLGKLSSRQRGGTGRDLLPDLQLEDVFTSLAVEGTWLPAARSRVWTGGRIKKGLRHLQRLDRSPDDMPPDQVRDLDFDDKYNPDEYQALLKRLGKTKEQLEPEDLPDDLQLKLLLTRPPLALDAIRSTPRLVLLGDPGAGKSTVLRYLALLLIHRLHGLRVPALRGWTQTPVPIFCPLARVAAAIKDQPPADDHTALWRVLGELLDHGGLSAGLAQHLRTALTNGGAIILLDGLDEISAAPGPDGHSLRERVSAAVDAFAARVPRATHIVVTCRVRPYQQAAVEHGPDWRLPEVHRWETRTIQPFEFGQVRQFVQLWYCAAKPTDEQAQRERSDSLLGQLNALPRLLTLTASPLLLTMLALVHFNSESGVLPADRARLYDECVKLMLERWEEARPHGGYKRENLLALLGIAGMASFDDLREVLHQVAYEVHLRPPDPSHGRGIISSDEVVGKMRRFFQRLRCKNIDEQLRLFEQVVRDETGLLHELGDNAYAFPHLTFQEYLAACFLANDKDGLAKAYAAWSGPDRDRWREALLLLMGRLRQQGKTAEKGEQWLKILLRERTPAGQPKPAEQRRHDALLAADSYFEWDIRAALSNADADELRTLEHGLVKALVPILTDEPMLPADDRVRAGFHLGPLGDPRPGVCTLPPAMVALPGGSFMIGLTKEELEREDEADRQPLERSVNEQPVTVAPFEIGRYPVTNAQYALFMAEGGYDPAAPWWDAAGRAWLERDDAAMEGLFDWLRRERKDQPSLWDDQRFGRERANHPVVGVSWYEGVAFCRWLSASERYNPERYTYQLPSEAEWEWAARGAERRRYPWGAEEPDAERANFMARHNGTTAVGIFAQGFTPECIADLAGNVWEWTRSTYAPYPDEPADVREASKDVAQKRFTFRGGAWFSQPLDLRTVYRTSYMPDFHYFDLLGFRLSRHRSEPSADTQRIRG